MQRDCSHHWVLVQRDCAHQWVLVQRDCRHHWVLVQRECTVPITSQSNGIGTVGPHWESICKGNEYQSRRITVQRECIPITESLSAKGIYPSLRVIEQRDSTHHWESQSKGTVPGSQSYTSSGQGRRWPNLKSHGQNQDGCDTRTDHHSERSKPASWHV